jgi:hypothetical protein
MDFGRRQVPFAIALKLMAFELMVLAISISARETTQMTTVSG